MAYNDLVEMTNAGSATQRRDLDALLRVEANTSLEALHAKTVRRVDRVRVRGKLTSEEQYYLVREHVESLADAPERAAEVQQLWALLHEFEERSAARAKKRAANGSEK